jgi:polysaccharide deacetylase 2 family uncharacterized protein YibQ
MRGFLSGVIWGGVVSLAGLAVISQVAPLPGRDAVTAPATTVPQPAPLPKAPEAEVQPEILQKGPDGAEEEGADTEAPAMDAAPVLGAPAAAPAETAVPEAVAGPAPAVQPSETMVELQPPTDVPTEDPAAPDAPAAPEAQGALPAALDVARPGAEAPGEPAAPLAEAAPAPADAVPPPPAPDDLLLRPDPAPAEEPAPGPQDGGALAEAPGLAPDAGIEREVPGVTTDRLPRIGDEDAMEAEALPELAGEAIMGTTPLELFARDFDNPEGKPLFSIILIDEGVAPEDRGNLAALPFPVTFAIDPLAPDSAEAARVYRQAGQEVAMLASGIPVGATPGDLEQSLQALDMALPEAVVVLDRPEGGLQAEPDLAQQLVPIVAEQGRGLLTYDRGLNPADQVARREGVPSAVIFRVLDSEGESIPKMRNYLDRAAFKAAQEGKVLVIGRAYPETVAAILEWMVEGRAATVAIAPVSAVLERAPSP